jgi:uncharacterized RDD family membrane protein YckC
LGDRRKYHIPYFERKCGLEGVLLATFWQRAAAISIDMVICAVILAVALILGGWLWWYREFDFIVTSYIRIYFSQPWFVQLVVDIAVPVIYFGLLTYFWRGKTVGKRIMKIRVVSLKSEGVGLMQSFDRAFGLTYSTMTLFFGFLRFFESPIRQTRHDKIVDTIVVDER